MSSGRPISLALPPDRRPLVISGPSGVGKGTLYTRLFERHPDRSEEHTSELQSRLHLVCRLLLEKKNTHYGGGSHGLLGSVLPPNVWALASGAPARGFC